MLRISTLVDLSDLGRKPFLWISPVHLSWSTLAINEFAQNYRYHDAMIITLDGVSLWLNSELRVVLEPVEMFLVLMAVALGLRLITMFTFTFRKVK